MNFLSSPLITDNVQGVRPLAHKPTLVKVRPYAARHDS